MSMKGKHIALTGGLAAVLVAATVAATVAVAGGSGAQGSSAPNSLLAAVGGSGGPLYAVRVKTENLPTTTNSTTYVPYMDVSVPVPPGESALINADFMAETRCSGGGTDPAWCIARINIGGSTEGHPKTDADASTFALDSTDEGTEGLNSWEGHAMSRCRVVQNNGTATRFVRVQVLLRVFNPNAGAAPDFWVDDAKLEARAHSAGSGCP